MSGGGGGQASGDDKNSMQVLWIIALVFLIGWVVWAFFSEELLWAFIKIRHAELWLMQVVLQRIPFWDISELTASLELTRNLYPDAIRNNPDLAEYLSEMAGQFYRWPIAVSMLGFAYVLYGRNVRQRYRKRYNMSSLREQEKTVWPQITAVSGLNLIEEELDSGEWAMSKTPLDFCKQHQMIQVGVEPPPPGKLSKGIQFKVILDHSKADRVFSAQLGRMWRGVEHMPPHRRALLAVFMARGCRDSQAATDLLTQMSLSAAGKHEINTKNADLLWKKHQSNAEVQQVLQSHAYEYSVFISMLMLARQDGVLATAEFLWLKPRDRPLWYVLNSVGRQTPCVEAAGVYAHWLAEKALRRPLSMPMIKEATKALELALHDIIYKPTPEEQAQILKATREQAS